jgi:hypothetical protein
MLNGCDVTPSTTLLHPPFFWPAAREARGRHCQFSFLFNHQSTLKIPIDCSDLQRRLFSMQNFAITRNTGQKSGTSRELTQKPWKTALSGGLGMSGSNQLRPLISRRCAGSPFLGPSAGHKVGTRLATKRYWVRVPRARAMSNFLIFKILGGRAGGQLSTAAPAAALAAAETYQHQHLALLTFCTIRHVGNQ